MTVRLIAFIITVILITPNRSFSQVNWTKYNNNPVLTKGPDNFDIIAVGQPATLFENDTIKMWYGGVGPDMKARICFAYSPDGISWIKHNTPVLDVGSSGSWDSGWLDTPEIVKDNTGYKMYYYGDTVQQFAAISSAIGVAFSNDGINWTKYQGNPIFTKGNPGDWDGSWVESPAVYFDSIAQKYYMWYNGVDTSTWRINIGLANSNDGINWVKYQNNPVIQTGNWGEYDDMWLGTPTVTKVDSFYEMWYSATSTNSYNYQSAGFDTVSICYATSADGIIWNKHSGNPLFHTFSSPYDSLVDTGGPWAPSVVYNPNTNNYMMWYEANGGNSNFSVSLATSPKIYSGLPTFTQTQECNVYPNPFTDRATFVTDALFAKNPYTFEMFNTLGEKVKTLKGITSKQFSISSAGLGKGIYFYNVRNVENAAYSGKVVIE